jgi:transposase-like protein
MLTLSCPHCHQPDHVVKFGTNRSGSARCLCKACQKTFAPQPNSRSLTAEKEAQIIALLQERVSQRGIARALRVGRQTIRALRKKGRTP